ncbi:MAG: hypothetical protein GY730_04575 [bacterium]|nr:hypothetical protein [bacterium]
MINICIFEDDGYKKLLPVTLMRPAYMLLIGINSIFDKINYYFDYANITLHCRHHIKPVVKASHKELAVNNINTGTACLFINGRTILDRTLFKTLIKSEKRHNLLFTYHDQIIAAYLHGEQLDYMKQALNKIPASAELIRFLRPRCVTKELSNISIIENLWDIIALNKDILTADVQLANQPGIIKGDIKPFASINNENNVFIDTGSTVEDFAVLNADNGHIYIEKDVYIESGTRLEGPLFIGRQSRIMGGRIKGTSIGSNCKVAGEVSDSIVSSFSNKAHFGFLGHSYIGEWVNLGAGTTTSNLKNTYGKVSLQEERSLINSNQTFLGSIIGDHARTGIGTMLNTGTVIGYGSNIYGTEVHPKYIPPFSWGSSANYTKYRLDKLFESSERMMKRRQKSYRKGEKEVIASIYSQITSEENNVEQ